MWVFELDKRKIEGVKQKDFLQLLSYKKWKQEMFLRLLKDSRWVWVFIGEVFHLAQEEYLDAIEDAVDSGWKRTE